MSEIVPYDPPFTLELALDNGTLYAVDFTGAAARHDAKFLLLWLHGKAEKTVKAYVADITRFYKCVGKSLQVATLEDLQVFVNSLVHLKPASRSRALAAVKSALSFGVKTGYLKVNVGAVVKLPKLEDKLAERIMSESSVARMLALKMNRRNHAILALLYRAGLRVSELCNLTWRNLQERDEAGQITVFGKGKKTRHVLIDRETWQEVMQLHKNEGPDAYVFQSRQMHSRRNKADRRLDESMVHRIVASAAKRAGITGNVSPHWMRHAHATHALENGAPITLVKETLGHKSIETTAKYTHVRPNASSGHYLKV
jgi:integrase/recombinase XerD